MPAMATLRAAIVGCALLLLTVALPACRTLTAGNGVITGTLNYPTGAIPAGATATVELVRLESGSAPSLITRTSLVAPNASPLPFVLNYDVAAINPEIPHALRASISSPQGSIMYATSSDVIIDFDGSPVALDLYASTGTTTTPPPGGTVSTPRR